MNFDQFLFNISDEPLRVLDLEIELKDYTSIDLSDKNKTLEQIDITDSKAFEFYIINYLNSKKAKVAFGGYLEKRNIYRRSSHFNQESIENERNVHLGVDLWCEANTKVLAVLDGKIHSFQNNINYGDYGPTIIIKHLIEGIEFYSLYGHLNIASLKNLTVGDSVFKGQTIGFLGNATVNGDYAPHLHFQLIKNLQDNFGDYPGVSNKKMLDFYKENCPEPNFLLKLIKL
jgi:murein DD-endopeptidase MepM/ murein hydrolase activator NlpD